MWWSMTLDDYKELLVTERVLICKRLAEAKDKLPDTTLGTAEYTNAYAAVQVWDSKLDMLNWFIDRANKIEMPKTKMREFL